jgi:uracil-DNA glycosylase
VPRGRSAFGHGVEVPLDNGVRMLGCYHPSQQNTFTGRLTRPMLRQVFMTAQRLAARDGPRGSPSRPGR